MERVRPRFANTVNFLCDLMKDPSRFHTQPPNGLTPDAWNKMKTVGQQYTEPGVSWRSLETMYKEVERDYGIKLVAVDRQSLCNDFHQLINLLWPASPTKIQKRHPLETLALGKLPPEPKEKPKRDPSPKIDLVRETMEEIEREIREEKIKPEVIEVGETWIPYLTRLTFGENPLLTTFSDSLRPPFRFANKLHSQLFVKSILDSGTTLIVAKKKISSRRNPGEMLYMWLFTPDVPDLRRKLLSRPELSPFVIKW